MSEIQNTNIDHMTTNTINQDTPLISIIIPVYNMKKHLQRCFESISTQTYQNFECILIDDGSTDGSTEFIDLLASRDHRFRALHKSNGGVSSARNLGLENVQGEWIWFCDADDWIPNYSLQKCVDVMNSANNIDLITFDLEVIDPNGSTRINTWNHIDNHQYNPCEHDSRSNLNHAIERCWCAVSTFFARTHFLMSHKVRFDEGISYSEDTAFFLKILANNPAVYHIDDVLYSYNRMNATSVMNNLSDKNYADRIKAFIFISDYLRANGLFESTRSALTHKFIEICIAHTANTKLYPTIEKAMHPHYNSKIFSYEGGNIRAKLMLWWITHRLKWLAKLIVGLK